MKTLIAWASGWIALWATSALAGIFIPIPINPYEIAQRIQEATQPTPGQVYQSKPTATQPTQKKRPKSHSSPTPSPGPSVAANPSMEEFVPTDAAEGTEKTNEGPRADFETIRARAESGDADCQYQLGLRYKTGNGVAKDFPQASKWYRNAADQGFMAAQSALALCYFHGVGVRKDFTEAVTWARKAADHGDAAAQNLLGVVYYHGEGVGKDPAEGVSWFRKAAEQNHAPAQNNLGLCYRDAKGVRKNFDEALKWFRKAAEQNYARAQVNLARCYHDGIGVRKDYVEAVKWVRKAAEQNYAKAEVLLGDWYGAGQGVAKNYEEAVNWYRKAADQNDPVAQWCLAGYFYSGKGVTKNYIECYKWLLLSAAQGGERARKATPVVERAMSQNQIAEGQRLARDFKSGEIRPTVTAISETKVSEVQRTADVATPEGPAISWREVDSIYNLQSNNTDLQKDEEWKHFKDKRVTWAGSVSSISDGGTGITLQVKMNPDTFTSDLLIRLKKSEKSKAVRLHAGDEVRFTGILREWGSLMPISLDDGEII